MQKGLRIVQLAAENFKKLTAIEITPQDDVVMITGPNGAGKSSVLDCITAALKGEREIPEEPIKKGADKGGIRMDLGSFQVIRNFTKKGSYLKIVKEVDGAPFEVKSPQKFLDEIVGKISFDPLDFMNLLAKDKKAARKTLSALVGLDVSDVDEEIAKVKADRQLVGRDHDHKKALFETDPVREDIGFTEISVAELTKKVELARANGKWHDAMKKKIDNLASAANEANEKRAQALAEIESFKQQIIQLEDFAARFEGDVHACNEQILKLQEEQKAVPVEDIGIYLSEITAAESMNKDIRRNRQSLQYKEDMDRLAGQYDSMTEQIRALEKIKADRVAGCKMPIPDLEIGDQGILYKGVPLEQAGDGEKLVVSMAISMAMNPKLKVLRIKDGSLLDSKNLDIIRNMVKENGFQVWIEKVAEDGRYGIFIEEGEVHQEQIPEQGSLAVE